MWLLAWLMACSGAPPAPQEAPKPDDAPVVAALDVNDPTACAPCHGAIVDEWQQSMHSRSHQDSDPVFAAMRTLRMEKQGAQIADKCAQCHSPLDPADPDSDAAKTGVSCAVCHLATAVDLEARGAKALPRSADSPPLLRGPHDLIAGASPVHGTGPAAPYIKDGQTVCLACHNAMKNPAGAPTCTTGPEHGDGTASCASCHMPRTEGPGSAPSERTTHASHAFLGPHRAWYQADPSLLRQAIDIEARFDGDTLRAKVSNRSSHAMPTGFPGRVAMLKVTGKDASGTMVWTNMEQDPLNEDPGATWLKVYVDAEDKPTLPPFAARLARDTRLEADEVRQLSWTPPATVQTVEFVLVLRLLPPPAVKALGLEGTIEAESRRILLATAKR